MYKYINKSLVLLIRYAKEKSIKYIECTVSSEGNRSREGKETGTKDRRSKTDIERIGISIRASKRGILQSQRCQTNPKEHWVVTSSMSNPSPSFFRKLVATYLILDCMMVAPYMLQLIPYIWRNKLN